MSRRRRVMHRPSSGWTPPGSDGGSAIDSYTARARRPATATTRTRRPSTAPRPRRRSAGSPTMSSTPAPSAHTTSRRLRAVRPSAPFTPTASGAQFSAVIDTSEGGVLEVIPEPGNFQGTVGRITIPPQAGPGVQVTVTASAVRHAGRGRRDLRWQRLHRPGHRVGCQRPERREAHAHRVLRVPLAGGSQEPEVGGRVQGRRAVARLLGRPSSGVRPVPHTDAARRVVGHDPGERGRPQGEDLSAWIGEEAFGPLTFGLRVLEAS